MYMYVLWHTNFSSSPLVKPLRWRFRAICITQNLAKNLARCMHWVFSSNLVTAEFVMYMYLWCVLYMWLTWGSWMMDATSRDRTHLWYIRYCYSHVHPWSFSQLQYSITINPCTHLWHLDLSTQFMLMYQCISHHTPYTDSLQGLNSVLRSLLTNEVQDRLSSSMVQSSQWCLRAKHPTSKRSISCDQCCLSRGAVGFKSLISWFDETCMLIIGVCQGL